MLVGIEDERLVVVVVAVGGVGCAVEGSISGEADPLTLLEDASEDDAEVAKVWREEVAVDTAA